MAWQFMLPEPYKCAQCGKTLSRVFARKCPHGRRYVHEQCYAKHVREHREGLRGKGCTLLKQKPKRKKLPGVITREQFYNARR